MVIEPDRRLQRELIAALGRSCAPPDAGSPATPACVHPANRLRHLHDIELGRLDLLVCALNLPDGSGLDALAYVRGTHPSLPVIVTADRSEAALAVEAIRAGAADFLTTGLDALASLPMAIEKCIAHQRIRGENERLQRELSRSLAERELKHQQLQMVVRKLESMARTDELTGLYNRRWLNLALEGAWAEASRHGLPLSFVMMDLDGFKPVNDRLGHPQGDALLRMIGKVVSANCRDVDVAARYGGDEFCILMPHTLPRQAGIVADRLLGEFDRAVDASPIPFGDVGMSVGVASNVLSRPVNSAQLLKHADEAMYAAKALRRSCIMARTPGGICEIDVLLGRAVDDEWMSDRHGRA